VKHFLFACGQKILQFVRGIQVFLAGGSECVVCGDRCGAVPVCRSCRRTYFTLSGIGGERCTVCGKVLVSGHGICMQCRTDKLLNHTDIVLPLYPYRMWNCVLLFRWKIEGERALSPFFADRIASALAVLPQPFTVVPVPPRPGKIRTNGWDQIDELCRFLEYRYGYRVCFLLERSTKKEQKTLDRKERLATIGKAYALKEEKYLKKALRATNGSMPESVCLIDDVMTTGATIESCAAALKSAGVKNVSVVTLFTVD
jgi:competence protein ComFC